MLEPRQSHCFHRPRRSMLSPAEMVSKHYGILVQVPKVKAPAGLVRPLRRADLNRPSKDRISKRFKAFPQGNSPCERHLHSVVQRRF